MASGSRSFNEVGTLIAEASSNPVHAGPLYSSDHQSASCETFSAFQPDASAVISHPSNDLDTTTVASAANQNGWATRESWARHRDLIKQLYRIQNKPLVEVMRLMESEHGFRATIKMYKDRIKKWGLDKKNKESEMRAIVRKRKQRADQGKGSVIRVRGQLQDFEKIILYWHRKGVSIEDIARQTASPTPEALEFSTPIPSPILTPQILAIPERIFHYIHNYVKGSFESGTWIKTEPTYQCSSVKDKGNGLSDIKGVFEDCSLAFSELSKGRFDRAAQQLDVATARIQNIFTAEHPSSLQMLFNLSDYLASSQKNVLLTAMFRSFSTQGKKILGSEHPLTRICEWLDSVHGPNFDDIMIRCIQSMTDELGSSVGPMHYSTLISRVKLISRETYERNARIQKMEKLLDECGKTMRADDVRILGLREDIAYEYYDIGCYSKAKTFLEKNIVWFAEGSSTSATLPDPSFGLSILAECQYALGEVDSGIETLHQAIELSMSTSDPQDSTTRKWLFLLEDWYVEQGLSDSAAQVQQWMEELRPSIIQNDLTQSGRWSITTVQS